jgi:hypothetical protein
MPSSEELICVALVRIDVSEERSTFIIRRRSSRHYVPPKRRFLEEPHGVTSKKIAFFIVTALKTSNVTYFVDIYLKINYFKTQVMRLKIRESGY